MADDFLGRVLRPVVILPALAVVVLVAVLLTPVGDEDKSPEFLTTRSTTLNGAKGLRQLLDRLGWATSERLAPFNTPLDSGTVYFVLGNQIELSETETHTLLEGVRQGARAIVIPEPGSAISDSIGLRASRQTTVPLHPYPDSLLGSYDRLDTLREILGGTSARTFHRYLESVPASDSDTVGVWPDSARSFLRVRSEHQRLHPEIAILRAGKGELVAIADPSFLRNDVLKRTAGALLAVRIMERIDPSGHAPVVFDEFHQGFGRTDSPVDVLVEALTLTKPGRAALQLAFAALLFLLAIGVRPIPPVSRAKLERRSPLEHVGALSRAYEAIDASRLVVKRLVGGMRRRHPLSTTRQLGDAEYLALLRVRLPALGADIDVLTQALAQKPTPEGLVAAGAAIDHIERNFIT